ncbi:ATP-dependent DNA helicase [Thalassotalea atypica]|uniref:ATP-dependent DNA helicase n=1 Tax=Thalassotalea atypica TaxID=2054316 RepID=UPI002572CCA6|nr:ATP-dependent DNA helicase [Thalassotalea atypica]
MSVIDKAFSSTGLLANAITGFSPRQAQLDMALEVEKAIEQRSTLIVEAGTGTGKTFAYLIPALVSEKKVIISTGTKNLQEQLYHKDIPLIKKALATSAQMALLKGRSNYLCLQRIDEYQHSRGQLDAQTLHDFVKVRTWANSTQTGDIGELDNIAEDSSVFPYVTSTVDNCLARDCPKFEECYLIKARQKAIDADVVVVNHHLFFADMALKDTGFGELIPKADVMIFDEAHQIADIASEYFGESFSTKQLIDLCNDVLQCYRTSLTDVKQLGKAAEKLQRTCQDFRLHFSHDTERGNWRDKARVTNIFNAFVSIKEDLDFLYQVLKLNVSRNEVVDNCFERAVNLLSKYDIVADIEAFGVSLWYETTRRHVVLHQTPLSIAEKFSSVVKKSEAGWVFTSATLAVNGGFSHFADPLGLTLEHTLMLDSPFDYEQQSQLIVPRYLPEAHEVSRPSALAELAIPLIEASQGSCFMLFTSYRIMNMVAEILNGEIDNPLLVQGQMTKSTLLTEFIASPDAVLLATASFWEGVDVRGDNLTCVIIDKLPFASPDDPLLQARSEDVRRQGGDPFADIQLPQAVIALKQGVGRLIRDITDKGVMVICDNRLVNRPYGAVFLNSLPPMKRSRDLKQATSFLTSLRN